MLWCEASGAEPQDVDTLAVLVAQLEALGLPACVDVRAAPAGLGRNLQFDLAPHLRDGPPDPGDALVLTGAHRLSDARLAALRRYGGTAPRACVAYGAFGGRQSAIAAAAKLSYVLGAEPTLVDLAAGPRLFGEAAPDAPVLGVARRGGVGARPRLLLVGGRIAEPGAAAALVGLALSGRFETAVLTDGKSKEEWIAAQGHGVPVFHYGEALPVHLAERADVAVFFVGLQRNFRLQCLAANLIASGAALLDGTRDHGLAKACDAFVRGPLDLIGLGAFLSAEVLPNLAAIAGHVRASTAARRVADQAALDPLRGHVAPPAPAPEGRAAVVFMPTNGVGLGHAQRCTLVADALPARKIAARFAVFPSCMGLVRRAGYDATPLIQRSALHAQTHENDLANYLRLRALCAAARVLVFDGGYVFDSVYRTLLEGRLRGVWIRRGLWQASQDNSVALDREKAFARVIAPREAFDELNVDYSHGDRVRPVGPIVQRLGLAPGDRAALRAALAERYGLDFERLVVTQLGAGVAADRTPHVQAICGMAERRSDTLHLAIVWPGAAVQPAWFGWRRSRVVKTHHAGVLAAAADLCVSAAGYNSFHEILYAGLPAVFVPQTGAFMDDQAARARAARERGLAAAVEPHELVALERAVTRALDAAPALPDPAARRTLLPEPGNAAAAALIEELALGDPALERARRPDRPAGRR